MKDELITRLTEKGFTVRTIQSPVDFLKAWNALMTPPRGPVAVLSDPITNQWLDRYLNIAWIPDETGKEYIVKADVGITGASYAIVDTGSLLLAEDSGFARLVSTMVSCHITLIPENRIRATWQDAVRDLRQGDHMPRILSFISGPSQTADIQGTLVKGMHGPVHVEAWLVPALDGPVILT